MGAVHMCQSRESEAKVSDSSHFPKLFELLEM